jgi:hypothetical protein
MEITAPCRHTLIAIASRGLLILNLSSYPLLSSQSSYLCSRKYGSGFSANT